MKGIDLEKIFSSMKQNDISEVIIKEGSKLYEVRRGGIKQNFVASAPGPVAHTVPHGVHSASPAPAVAHSASPAASADTGKTESASNATESSEGLYEVKSPLVGTFYSAPKPDAPSFVEVGDKIKKGQTLCIVEAMKNFNEIESEVSGVIKEICVSTGDLIEFGKVLFKVELQ